MHTLIAQQDPAAGQPGILPSLLPFALIFFVMWFLVIRPQKKQEKERQSRVDGIQRGDRVRTRGGIVAPVIRIKDDVVVIGLGGDRAVEVEVSKAYIDDVIPASKTDGK